MKSAYIITKGEWDKKLLDRILPASLTGETKIIAAGGKYSAESLAPSLLAVKQTPVGLVVDADTTEGTAVWELEDFLKESLNQVAAGVAFEVFLAVPEIEILFFQNKAIVEKLSEKKLTDMEWQLGQLSPKAFLKTSMGPDYFEKCFAKLADSIVAEIQKHPLIQKISDFLREQVQAYPHQEALP